MFTFSKASVLRPDFLSGFIVFLIALPLCVGISIASLAPPTAGIITAIIGGILGSYLSGSYLTINGPAAGLIVIIAGCIESFGGGIEGYRAMLACTIIAGFIQVGLGLVRAGTFGLAFPATVIHAMLSAIGLIIISKNLYVMLGITAAGSPLALYAALPQKIFELNPAIATIGIVGLLIMVVLNFQKNPKLKKLPIPLVTVLAGILLGEFVDLAHEHKVLSLIGQFSVGPKYLLEVPDNISEAFFLPNFAHMTDFNFWKQALIIAFVASIESILSACAVDRLDPMRRVSDLNKELKAKGFCNAVAASIGGLPMIAEIVRSSANISYGAKSQWSNFFHGVFLLAFLALFPHYLHHVPLASLAAILVYIGYQLAKPAHLIHALSKGRDQAAVYVFTVFCILLTDLLLGVFLGAMLEFLIVASKSRTFNLFKLRYKLTDDKTHTILEISSPLNFTNYLAFRSNLEKLHKTNGLTIDLRKSRSVDNTVREHLTQYSKVCLDQGRELNVFMPAEKPQPTVPLH